MPTIKIPTPLRPYTDGNQEIAVEGQTVDAVVRDLIRQYPGLNQHLFDEDLKLRPFVNIFLNNEDIRLLQGVETKIKDGDRLMIVPSIAGGRDLLQTTPSSPSIDHRPKLITSW